MLYDSAIPYIARLNTRPKQTIRMQESLFYFLVNQQPNLLRTHCHFGMPYAGAVSGCFNRAKW